MNGCYCWCDVHQTFAGVRCRGVAEMVATLTGVLTERHGVEMCAPCAVWWEESQTLRVIEPRGRRAYFDSAAFYRAVHAEMTARKVPSEYQALKQAGIASPGTLSRIGRGGNPDVHTLVRLMRWMDRTDIDCFVTYRGTL